MKPLLFLLLVVGCQNGDADRTAPAPAPAPKAAPTAAVPGPAPTGEYAKDIEKLCNVMELSGAGEDDSATLTTANWLAANLSTPESRKFLVAIQPLVGIDKADALDAEAKRVGVPGCALAEMWRKPGAVPLP